MVQMCYNKNNTRDKYLAQEAVGRVGYILKCFIYLTHEWHTFVYTILKNSKIRTKKFNCIC